VRGGERERARAPERGREIESACKRERKIVRERTRERARERDARMLTCESHVAFQYKRSTARICYEVATVSRIDEIIGLFCRMSSLL